jgi:flavin-dependent dehydrogenase
VKISSKSIVAADGVRSPIRAALKMDMDNYLAVLQYRVRLSKPQDSIFFFGNSQIEHGLGWFVPRGKSANVGFGVLKQVAHALMFKLHQLLDRLIALEMIEPDDLNDKTGGLIPVSDPSMPPGKDGIFLVGDAAGLRDTIIPGVGLGLGTVCQSGILAGKMIAEEILKKKTPRIEGYMQELKPLVDGRLPLQSSLAAKKMGPPTLSPKSPKT